MFSAAYLITAGPVRKVLYTVFQRVYNAELKNKNKSLILLIKTALSAALFALIREYQKLINKKEHNPTPSQPQKTNNKLSPAINNNIKKVNNNKYMKNLGK